MNDFVDAVKTRLNSPVLGFFGLALLAFNWQAFFFLVVQEGDALTRIQFFEQHTSTSSLVVWPLSFSLVFSVLYPWLLFLVIWITARPNELKEMVQATSEHKVLVRRKQLEEARSNLLAHAEQELIERAKRDQELDQLQNEDLKQKLRQELEQLRAERDSLREQSPSLEAHKKHKEFMDIAATYRARSEEPSASLSDRERFRKRAYELEEKAYRAVMQSDASQDANGLHGAPELTRS